MIVMASLLCSAFASAPAAADTLRDALVSAYETNPSLTAAREGQKATNEGVPLAKANGRPDVSIQSTYFENIMQDGGSSVTQARGASANGTISAPVYAGGGIRNAVRAAENRVEAGFAGLRGTESAIFSAVVAAYMDVIRDESIVELNRAQVGVLSVNLDATRDRFEIGDLTRTDVAQSEARQALATSNLETARANLIRSKEIYIQLVGREPGQLSAPPPLPNLPDTPDNAVNVALENNPDLIAAREAKEAAGFDRRAANASRLPTVSVFTSPSYSNALNSVSSNIPGFQADNSSFTAQAGIRATLPLYQGGQPAAQIRQAQARLGQAQEQEIAAEREVIAQTRASYASWRAANDVIIASQRAVSANELSLEGTRAENSVGNRTILDILNAEQELLGSKVQLVTARRNAYVAGFTLLAAMGRAEARDLGLEGGVLYDPVAEYEKVDNAWNDWSSQPDPTTKSTRTVDTPAQKAEIEPLPDPTRK
ncbi:TolC family outer membrane protein [Sphingorhabdus sp.]|uniref:TolC family outer membrane protein n=1 Tax=Sphingorhabdus sp. TaxID=1902408 RepID=UPI0035937671